MPRLGDDVLAAALDAASTPALVVSLEGEIAYVNLALLGATGHAAGELVGRPSGVLFPPGVANAFDAARVLLEKGQRWRGEVGFLRKDGTIFQHDLSLAPVAGEAGCVTRAVGTCLDLTERRSQARLLLTDRMVSVGTLAAGVAHEINNPLSFVLTNLSFLADTIQELQSGAPELDLRQALREVGEAVGEVRVGAERVRDIVRDLKSFSRGDDGARQRVDVQQVLEASTKMTWNEIRHRARLVREYGTDVPPVEAEEARLGQVFLNLILNAVQAIPEGDAKANEIRVTTRGEGDRVVVEVRDTGGGIPASVRPHLFEPFFTTKPVGVGTGLGLYISREIVTGLGGTIAVESTPGAGTLFRVTLPAQGAAPLVGQATGPPVSLVPRGRVLVVDDDPLIGLTIARLLARHEVILANAGREALARLQRGERFDLVLCDLMMPDMSGMELHAEVERAWPDVAATMVFLTGGVFTPEAAAFVERTRNTIVEKPFDPEQLRALVARRLAERMRR